MALPKAARFPSSQPSIASRGAFRVPIFALGLNTAALLWLNDAGTHLKISELSTRSDDIHDAPFPARDGVLGAVDAVREQKRDRHVAGVGQDCIVEAMVERRKDKSPLIGSVSHQTSSYGPSLIHLGLQLLRGQTVPPYNYVEHKLVTQESLE